MEPAPEGTTRNVCCPEPAGGAMRCPAIPPHGWNLGDWSRPATEIGPRRAAGPPQHQDQTQRIFVCPVAAIQACLLERGPIVSEGAFGSTLHQWLCPEGQWLHPLPWGRSPGTLGRMRGYDTCLSTSEAWPFGVPPSQDHLTHAPPHLAPVQTV